MRVLLEPFSETEMEGGPFPPASVPEREGGPSLRGPSDELYGAVRPFLPDDLGAASMPTAAEGEGAPQMEPEQGVSPYPYLDNEVIGGDSVKSIQERLLSRHLGGITQDVLDSTLIDARDRFEVKVDILAQMPALDPGHPWMEHGARALENSRTSTGEHSHEQLFHILEQLRRDGVESEAFSALKNKFWP
ncbi:putative mitochondrial protein AtMg01010 [Tasmannia lanceolata]